MRKIIIGLIIMGIIILFAISTKVFLTSNKNGYKKFFEQNIFSFDIPSSWKQKQGKPLEEYREIIEELLPYFSVYYHSIYKNIRSNETDDAVKRVPYLVAFVGPGDISLTAFVILTVPDESYPNWRKETILEGIFEDTKKGIDEGVSRGQIYKVISHRKTEINGIPAVEEITERKEQDKTVRDNYYYFYSPEYPHQVIKLEIHCNTDLCSTYQSVFDHILSTFQVNFPRGAESLINALKDKHEYIKVQATEALGELGDSRAVDPLIAIVRNKNNWWILRLKAIRALGCIKDSRAVEPLKTIFKNEEWDGGLGWEIAGALQDITGQDSTKWQEWWEKNKEKFGKRK